MESNTPTPAVPVHHDGSTLEWKPLGRGWEEAVLILPEGDTAWNPASTKTVIYGPATVTYQRDPNGITAYVE